MSSYAVALLLVLLGFAVVAFVVMMLVAPHETALHQCIRLNPEAWAGCRMVYG